MLTSILGQTCETASRKVGRASTTMRDRKTVERSGVCSYTVATQERRYPEDCGCWVQGCADKFVVSSIQRYVCGRSPSAPVPNMFPRLN